MIVILVGYYFLDSWIIYRVFKMGGSAPTPYNYELPNSKEKGFTPIYRKRGMHTLMTSPEEGVNTLVDLLKVSNQRYGNKESIGTDLIR